MGKGIDIPWEQIIPSVVVPSIVGAMYYMGFGDETEKQKEENFGEEKQNERGR